MSTRRLFAKSILGAALAAGLGGVAAAQPAPPYPPGWSAPPPLRYEAVPPPPGPAFIWVPGHWRWNGYRYIWIGGHYDRRRHGWNRWVDGHWAAINGRWVWIDGHWR